VQSVLSGLIGGAIVACIAGMYSLRAKRNEYVAEFYKTVIARRIGAYEQLENLVLALKTCVVAEDSNRPYHIVFSTDDGREQAFDLLGKAMSQGLWLSNDVWAKLRDLNYLLFNMPTPPDLIEFGRINYEEIAILRTDLEQLLAKDMLDLHDVKRFLMSKAKKDSDSFHMVQLKKPID
jgi:hypothetical protein